MRLALFVAAERNFAVSIERIVHIIARPTTYRLPLLKRCFSAVFLDGQEMIPLLELQFGTAVGSASGLVIVCDSDFGKVGIPAERVLRVVDQSSGDLDDCVEEPMFYAETDLCFNYAGKRYPLLNVDAALCRFRTAPGNSPD